MRHATMSAPTVVKVMVVARHAAVWVVPRPARVAAQRGRRGTRVRPLAEPRAAHGAGSPVAQTGACVVGTQLLLVVVAVEVLDSVLEVSVVEVASVELLVSLADESVAVLVSLADVPAEVFVSLADVPEVLVSDVSAVALDDDDDDDASVAELADVVTMVEEAGADVQICSVGSPSPMLDRRHVRIDRGFWTACWRQLRAVPTANGPRAAVQATTFCGTWVMGSVPMARHGAGSWEMQIVGVAAFRQARRFAPEVVRVMLADRHVAIPPTVA